MTGAQQMCCPVCHGSGVWAKGHEDVSCDLCSGTGRVGANVRQGDDTMPHAGSVKATKQNRRIARGKS